LAVVFYYGLQSSNNALFDGAKFSISYFCSSFYNYFYELFEKKIKEIIERRRFPNRERNENFGVGETHAEDGAQWNSATNDIQPLIGF
jgi:hypothetical protein